MGRLVWLEEGGFDTPEIYCCKFLHDKPVLSGNCFFLVQLCLSSLHYRRGEWIRLEFFW